MTGCRNRLCVLMVMVSCLALVQLGAWAQQPRPGGTLRVAWEADVTGLDPHVSSGIQAYYVVGNLFNSLVTIDAELNYVPDLAESWDVLDDGKVYVFHLRKEVKFHDGTDFDAQAVRWNYQRIVNPEEKAIDLPFYSIVESVEALDAHTVKFTLKHPSATLLPVMAAKRISTQFNQRNPVFKDVRVRRALLGYGIDRQAIAKTALLGLAQPLWSFVPSGSKGHIDFGELYPYDPEKAKTLLKEAGFDEKNPLRYTIMTHGGEASLPTIATIMKTQYAKLGVEVTVEVIDRPIFLRRMYRDRDWDQLVNLTAATFDPYSIARAIDSRAGNNTINHDDKQVDALIDRMKEAGTEEAFLQVGQDFQRYIAENMMTTGIASFPFLQAARSNVKGYVHLHGYKIRFEPTWLDK